MDLPRLPLAAAACVVAALAAAAPAEATFPGRNGVLVSADLSGNGRYVPAIPIIATRNPRTGADRWLASCGNRLSAFGRGAYACEISDPVVSPDGRRIAFAGVQQEHFTPSAGSRNSYFLGLMGTSGNDPRTVATKEYYHVLKWSPDGGSLVGVRASDAGIYAVSLDGREAGRLVAGPARSIDVAATGLIALVRPVAPPCTSPPCIPDEIFVATAGGVARRLTFGGGDSPSWAPDGRRLAFTRGRNVYTARADGSGLRRLTFKGGSWPVWSPDGKRIVFLRKGALLTTRPNGKGLRRLRRDHYCLGCGFGVGDWQALRKRR